MLRLPVNKWRSEKLTMKVHKVLILICLSLAAPSAFAQSNGPTGGTAASPAVPEEARRHFVIGTTLFKDAKSHDDFVQVVSEFKQATDLAPQWPEARYNLALVKESAEDYSGAIADFKIYQKFSLSESEARTVQDKIYVLEAKQQKKDSSAKLATDKAKADEAARLDAENVYKGLDGGIWKVPGPGMGSAHITVYIEVHGHQIKRYPFDDLNGKGGDSWNTVFTNRHFRPEGHMSADPSEVTVFDVTISDDGQTITETYPNQHFIYKRIR